jgi:hypothetical protein
MSGLVCSPFENITQTYYPNYGVDITRTKLAIETTNVCGSGYYIKRHTDNCLVGCTPCDDNDKVNDNAAMCSDNEQIWKQAHLDDNMAGTPNNKWKDISTVLMVDSDNVESGELESIKATVKEWYINRMDDSELSSIMQNMKWGEDIDKDNRLRAFKTTISSGRGTTIPCHEPDGNNNVKFGNDSIDLGPTWNKDDSIGPEVNGYKRWEGCDDSFSELQPSVPHTFGPKNISQSEFLEWSMEYDRQTVGQESNTNVNGLQEDDVTVMGDISKDNIGMKLFPPNMEFERCINELLNTNDDYNDSVTINDIRGIKNINGLTNIHIQFIKKKLELLIISSSKEKVKDCIKKNIPIEDICNTSLSFKMMMVLNILFSTIGFNLDLDNANTEDDKTKDKLIGIIDELGDLIPRSLDKIIEISKEIEQEKCNNVSGKTLLLEELQHVLFNPPKQNIKIELPDFNDVVGNLGNLNSDGFNRFAILAGIGLAVFKFI